MIQSEVVTVTPEIALQYIGANTSNRQMNPNNIKRYVSDMRSGAWKMNAEAIKFDADGRLIDGQHRLTAVVESGVTVEMLVVRGLPPEVVSTLDTGKVRTGADILAISGLVEGTASICIATAIGVLLRYESGAVWVHGGGAYKHLQTNERVVAYFRDHHRELDENWQWLRGSLPVRGLLMPSSDVLALFTICARIDRELAVAFFTEVFKGSGLVEDSVSFHLRNRLIAAKTNSIKTTSHVLRGSVILCWNRIRAGRTVKAANVMWKTGESTPFAK